MYLVTKNFDKSRQLSTIRCFLYLLNVGKEKMGEVKFKKTVLILGQIIKLANAGNFPVFLFSPKYV